MNMKAINIKLATFSFAAMLLASCSDSGTPGNDSVIDLSVKLLLSLAPT